MRIKIDFFNILIILTSLISIIVTTLFFNNITVGYHMIIVFPLIFIIFYLFILNQLRSSLYPFVSYGIIGMQWIKMVLMPPILALAGNNVGVFYINPNPISIKFAIVLILYEFIVSSIFSFIWLLFINSPMNKNKTKNLSLSGNRFVYILFLVLMIFVSLTIGRSNNLLNFLIIPLSEDGRIGDITDTSLILARQIIIIGLFLFFLLITNWSKEKYDKSRKEKYINYALIAAFINLAFIVGERRSAQIYTALITIWILIKTFPKFKKRIYIIVYSSALFVLIFMSIYKFFGAFLYTSYADAVHQSDVSIEWLSRTLLSYFFGPENVAITIDFKRNTNIDLGNYIYDHLRSTFGLSFLLKGDGILTSEIFNTYVYNQPMKTGHVISSVGYGYLYFGALLSPIISIINIIISSLVEKAMNLCKSYEMTYIWGLILVRFITNLFVNTPPLVSNATMTLGTGGLLFAVAIILRRITFTKSFRGGID